MPNELLNALNTDDIALARRLIQQDKGLEANESGITPFMFAVHKGQEEIVALLLEKGVDVNQVHPDDEEPGSTALFIAVEKGHSNILELLLKNGANPNLANEAGTTPLLLAIDLANLANLGVIHMIKELLKRGADPNQADAEGNTPLHYAVAIARPDIIKILFSAGAVVPEDLKQRMQDLQINYNELNPESPPKKNKP